MCRSTQYFQKAVPSLVNGWMVDFASVPALRLDSQIVKVNKTAVVIGLANGWAGKLEDCADLPGTGGGGTCRVEDTGTRT